jgi:prepilin-type processing-associated H-X9-DG protein
MGRLLVWGVAIIVIGGMISSVLLPSLCKSSETANRVKCGANLRQIGSAVSMYAQENGGYFPPSLVALMKHEDITFDCLLCPSSNDEKPSTTTTDEALADLGAAERNAPGHKNCLSYVYVGTGLNTKTVLATTVVAFEPLEKHNGQGANVLFGDGHVEFVYKQDWPKVTGATGRATPASNR